MWSMFSSGRMYGTMKDFPWSSEDVEQDSDRVGVFASGASVRPRRSAVLQAFLDAWTP